MVYRPGLWEGMSDHPVQTGDPEGFDSVAIWMQERLGKWAAFADDIMSWEGITVLDGQLYHGCVDSLLYYDVPPVDIDHSSPAWKTLWRRRTRFSSISTSGMSARRSAGSST